MSKGKTYRFLLDCGQSGLFWENAERLNLDLKQVDGVFLSHAHYDHANGLQTFLSNTDNIPVYCLPDARTVSCWKLTSEKQKYIGINPNLLVQYQSRFSDLKEMPWDFVHVIPTAHNHTDSLAKRDHLYTGSPDKPCLDDFSHEMALVIEENGSLAVFCSCSHAGVDAILAKVKELFPDQPVCAFIGGFHLKDLDLSLNMEEEQKTVENLAQTLLTYDQTVFYTGHCTGEKAFNWMKPILQDQLHSMQTGRQFEILCEE